MKKVWKYALPKPENQQSKVAMPAGAEILGLQGDTLMALVDTEASIQEYTFVVVKTDEEFVSTGTKYVGSYMKQIGTKVSGDGKYQAFHIFQMVQVI